MKYIIPVLFCALMIPSFCRAAMVIDDFSTGGGSFVATSPSQGVNTAQGPLPTADVLGGYRQIKFTVPPTPTGTAEVDIDTTKDRFTYATNVTSGTGMLSAIDFTVEYNGGSSTTSNMNVNLAADGSTGLAFNFEYANFSGGGTGHFDVTIASGSNGNYFYLPVPSSQGSFTVYVPFSEIGGFDPHHVTDFSFGTDNGNLPGGFALDSITTAPEPATSVGVAFLLAAFSCRRRSRRM